MRAHGVLDLERRNLVSPTLDDVDVLPAEQAIGAVFDDGDVAGAKPAVAERGAREIGPPPVFGKQSRTPHFDFTTPLSKAQDEFILGPTITCSAGVSPCNLENVSDAAAGATLSGPVSSGEVSVPEPASMALLGTALLGAALLLGRMIRIPEGTGTYQA